ncbi:hypothetical protein OAB57_00175 [Bacteriovoracaceae bacterium]|nr:hypothetical protein [Bacteriovoracaceae bacterium]
MRKLKARAISNWCVLFGVVLMVSCSSSKDTSHSEGKTGNVSTESLNDEVKSVDAKSELGQCTDKEVGIIRYVLNENNFYVCSSLREWAIIVVNGQDGENGQDGANGQDGENGQDGRHGQAGENGQNGEVGENGVSCSVLTNDDLSKTLMCEDGSSARLTMSQSGEIYEPRSNERFGDIVSNGSAFAALQNDKTVLTWGNIEYGGDSSSVQEVLHDVKKIYTTLGAFAALKEDGTVVTWGHASYGGDSSIVAEGLTDIKEIHTTNQEFLAVRNDRTFVYWGGFSDRKKFAHDDMAFAVFSTEDAFLIYKGLNSVELLGKDRPGRDPVGVNTYCVDDGGTMGSSYDCSIRDFEDVKQIITSEYTFVGVRENGDVFSITSGNGTDKGTEVPSGLSDVVETFSNKYAFAALKNDGSVVSWGNQLNGGDSSDVQEQLFDIVKIFSNERSFAALRNDGEVIAWGDRVNGGNISGLSNVRTIYSTDKAFAAIKNDGSVVAWGSSDQGSDTAVIDDQLVDVIKIYSNKNAFAAIKSNGTVVTWGSDENGGDSSGVKSELYDITDIYSTDEAFVAVREDDSIITWGNKENGADTSQLNRD